MSMLKSQIVPKNSGAAFEVLRGQRIRVAGRSIVDFVAFNLRDLTERFDQARTKTNQVKIFISAGDILYSKRNNPMMTIVEDTCGWNDTVAGCCSVPSNQLLYEAKSTVGCRENFLKELQKHHLGRRDIVPNLNFFCRVPVQQDGALASHTFVEAPSKPGDLISLRAEMDVLAVISNCPQINNPCSGGKPTAVKVTIAQA